MKYVLTQSRLSGKIGWGLSILRLFIVFLLTPGICYSVPDIKLPAGIGFIENNGQWDRQVAFKADLPHGALFVTGEGFVFNFESASDRQRLRAMTCGRLEQGLPEDDISTELVRYHAYRVDFVGADTIGIFTKEQKRSYYHNYFLGADTGRWATNVCLYERIIRKDLYKGVDLAVYSRGGQLKYDFIVAPGADPGQIALGFGGVIPQITREGHLLIRTAVNEVIEQAPYVYQVIDGREVTVPCRYYLQGGQLTFELLASYNCLYPLILDPVLVFSTYSGAEGKDHLNYATTYDKMGNLYAGAQASDIGWPVTMGAYQLRSGGSWDVGINKYNSDGSALLFSTYFGGEEYDWVKTMIVNKQGELIIAGTTTSKDLPHTHGCFDSVLGGIQDYFIARFNSMGTALLGSTYIGSSLSDQVGHFGPVLSPIEIALDAESNIWVAACTEGRNFPVTANAFQTVFAGGGDGVLLQMDPSCSRLLYSTYLGGKGADLCFNLVVNHKGHIVICGSTTSEDFPVTGNVIHRSAPGGKDGFVSVLDPGTGKLLRSTYLGTQSTDYAVRLQLDEEDNVFVLGLTSGNYPLSSGVYHLKDGEIFIDKLSADLSKSLLSTRIGNDQGGPDRIVPSAFLYDVCGRVYFSGFNASPHLPTTADAYQTRAGGFWFCVLDPDFRDIQYASYFGEGHSHEGIHRFDPMGVVYQTVCSPSDSFPVTAHSVFPRKKNIGVDNVSFKFDLEPAITAARFVLENGQRDTGCAPYKVSFSNLSVRADTYTWDFGDGSPVSHETNPEHTFTKVGSYRVTLYATNDSSCNGADTSYHMIEVFKVHPQVFRLEDTLICTAVTQVNLSVHPDLLGPHTRVIWGPLQGILSEPDSGQITVDPNINSVYYVWVVDTVNRICGYDGVDTIHIDVAPRLLSLMNGDTTICRGDTIWIQATGSPGYTYRWSPADGVGDINALAPIIMAYNAQTYTLKATYPGCPDTAVHIAIDVEIYPRVDIGSDQTLCPGEELVLEAKVDPYRNDYRYSWGPVHLVANPGQPNTMAIADSSGWYHLMVTTPSGCSGSDSVAVRVVASGFGSAIADTGYCAPGSVTLWADGGARYLWRPADGLNDSTLSEPLASPASSTLYTVYIWDTLGCRDSHRVKVAVWPQAVIALPDSIMLISGEKYHLQPATNCFYFNWFPSSGINNTGVADPWFSSEVRTRYTVTAVTEHGCSLVDSVDILVHCGWIDLPNAFAPRGANAVWSIPGANVSHLEQFSIYNRWGNKVFETTDINAGWDGTYKGRPQPLGVYVYEIEGLNKCGKAFYKSGNVTLIR